MTLGHEIQELFKRTARSHTISAERRSIRSRGSNPFVSRLAENLNSNICDGCGPRQQMDVWFRVSRRNPIQKRFEKDCGTYIQPAPSERDQGFFAFPLTLLIMDVRYARISDM